MAPFMVLAGYPYAPGAAGNIATEALVDWFAAKGVPVGVDRAALKLADGLARLNVRDA